MSKNPKIVVFKLKELIYTGIFILLGILLIILLVWMFKSGKTKDTPASNTPVNTNTADNNSFSAASDNSDISAANKTTNNESTGNSSANEGTTGSSTGEGTTGNSTTNEGEGTTSNSTTNEGEETTGNSESTTSYSSGSDTEKQTQKNTSGKKYSPGVYTTALMLNNCALEIEVCVDSTKITSISIKNMDTGIKTMYPLIENSMKDLEYQIVTSQSLENITYTDDCKYTYLILIDGVSQALSKAELK